jgi:uncharacterized protein with NRDE domain
MCLVLVSWRAHPAYLLVVAANRDEFYERPSAPLGWWPDEPEVLAGRDLADAGGPPGTWMGVARGGRFAAVTNVRTPARARAVTRSRGELPSEYLRGEQAPGDFLAGIAAGDGAFNGFNLLVSDLRTLWWHSNRAGGGTPRLLSPGRYGLSNAALDTPWPKVRTGAAAFADALTADDGRPDAPVAPYLAVLSDRRQAPDDDLPETGIPLEWERVLSSRFISSPVYGTRSSTVLRVRHDGSFDVTERGFGPEGPAGERCVRGVLHLADQGPAP